MARGAATGVCSPLAALVLLMFNSGCNSGVTTQFADLVSDAGDDVFAECFPVCRDGFVCHQGTCVDECNPPCPDGFRCQGMACVAEASDPGTGTDTQDAAVDPDSVAPDVPLDDPGADVPPLTDLVLSDVPPADLPSVDNGPDATGCFDDPVGSCRVFYACANACSPTDRPCLDLCNGALSPAGRQQALALATCQESKCGDVADESAFDACISEKCLGEYYGCFWGCQYSTCGATAQCLWVCRNDATPQTCSQDCWAESEPQASLDLEAAFQCMRLACPVCQVADPTPAQTAECDTCWSGAATTTCSADWDKCQPYGTSTCGEMLSCVNDCADDACTQGCFDSGTETASELWNVMVQCGRDACTASCPENPTPEQGLACNECMVAAINEGGSCYPKLQECLADQAAR